MTKLNCQPKIAVSSVNRRGGLLHRVLAVGTILLMAGVVLAPQSAMAGLVPGAAFHLDASDDASFSGTLAGGFGAVDKWDDMGSAGLDVTPPATIPTRVNNVLNGLPVVRFGGANDERLLNMSGMAFQGAQQTVFAVYKTGGTSDAYILENDNGGTQRRFVWEGLSPRKVSVGVGGGGGELLNGGFTAGNYIISSGLWNGGGSLHRIIQDDLSVNDVAGSISAASPTANGIIVGGLSVVTPATYAGDIAEVVIYNSALSTADRLQNERFLQQKWFVALKNPETFQTYSLGDDLTRLNGWSADVGNTADANPSEHGIVAGGGGGGALALEIVDPNDVNVDMFWQQLPLDADAYPDQRLSYDVLLSNQTGSTERAFVSQGMASSFFATLRKSAGGTRGAFLETFDGSWHIGQLATESQVAFDTWYHVDVDMDFENNTARMRFGPVGGPMSAFTSELGSNLLTDLPFRFNANDTVRFDNIALRIIPEPASFVLFGLGLIAMAARGLRRRK